MKAFDELATLTDPRVPDLSPGIGHLLSAMASDNMTVTDAARELELYPVITARLIALANSAWSSPVSPVSNVEDAFGRLGLDVVKSAAIAYAVAAPFNQLKCPTFDPIRFWCCCLLGAEAAGLLGDHYGLDRSFSRTAGMLRNLGLVWLADAAPELTGEALAEAADDDEKKLADLMAQKIGGSHNQATVHLLRVWGLGRELLDACAPENEALLAVICRVSSYLASCVYLDMKPCDTGPIYGPLAPDEMERVTCRLERSAERTTNIAQSIAA